MQRNTQFAFRVNEDERRAISELASRLQRSQSDAVRYVVTEAVRKLSEAEAKPLDHSISVIPETIKI